MIPEEARRALEEALGESVRFDAPLARHTSLQVGGRADAIATPRDRDQVAQVLALCARHGLPRCVLGGGFNSLVPDAGLRGVVLQLTRLRRLELRSATLLWAEAGVSHAQITGFCRERGLAGLEFGVGIPGTLGGWLVMNAGIGERETRDAVREIEVMSADGGRVDRLERASLDFRYRALHGVPAGGVVLAALLEVRPDDPARVRDEMQQLLARRAATQPLNRPSCGSVFKNPPGDFAGRLIEAAGLKGARIGGAEISTVHANFIVNVGDATAHDVLALMEHARSVVRERLGVELEPEVHVLGGTP